MANIEVRPLTRDDAETCDQIILTLPNHFGSEAGRKMCARAVRTSEGWVAVQDDRVTGFLSRNNLRDHLDGGSRRTSRSRDRAPTGSTGETRSPGTKL